MACESCTCAEQEIAQTKSDIAQSIIKVIEYFSVNWEAYVPEVVFNQTLCSHLLCLLTPVFLASSLGKKFSANQQPHKHRLNVINLFVFNCSPLYSMQLQAL